MSIALDPSQPMRLEGFRAVLTLEARYPEHFWHQFGNVRHSICVAGLAALCEHDPVLNWRTPPVSTAHPFQ